MPLFQVSTLNKYGNLRSRIVHRDSSQFTIRPKGFGKFIGVKRFKYEHVHSYVCPALTVISGKKYLLPDWKEVDPKTTLEDINWIKPKIKIISKSKPITQTHISGSGLGEYTTKYYPDSGKYHCSCPGYWRSKGNCKHVKKMKNE